MPCTVCIQTCICAGSFHFYIALRENHRTQVKPNRRNSLTKVVGAFCPRLNSLNSTSGYEPVFLWTCLFLYVNIHLIWLQTSEVGFSLTNKKHKDQCINHFSLWKITIAYTKNDTELHHAHFSRLFSWKNSVKFSCFLEKLRIHLKHSFSEWEKRRLTLSIFNRAMVTGPERFKVEKAKPSKKAFHALAYENFVVLKQSFVYFA